jgi:hypothetical protein
MAQPATKPEPQQFDSKKGKRHACRVPAGKATAAHIETCTTSDNITTARRTTVGSDTESTDKQQPDAQTPAGDRGMMQVIPVMKGVMHQHACWRQPEGSQQVRTASQPIKQKPASMPCTAHKTSEHMPLFNGQTKLPRPGFGVE